MMNTTGKAICALSLLIVLSAEASGQERRVTVAVTLPDIVPIVRAVGGSMVRVVPILPQGVEPHSYTLTAENIAAVQECDLIVYGHGGFLHAEEELKAAASEKLSLDFADYERNGAVLKDFPGFPQNRHGSWLSFDNARAIAVTVAATLTAQGADPGIITNNLAAFTAELEAAREAGARAIVDCGLAGATLVAVVPEVSYVIDNLGLKVGAVLMEESTGVVASQTLTDVASELRSGEYIGIVCPLSMKEGKAGEVARQLSSDTGAPVCYVMSLQNTQQGTFLSQAAYNACAIASLAARHPSLAPQGSPVSTLIWGFIVFALVVALVMQNRRKYYAS